MCSQCNGDYENSEIGDEVGELLYPKVPEHFCSIACYFQWGIDTFGGNVSIETVKEKLDELYPD